MSQDSKVFSETLPRPSLLKRLYNWMLAQAETPHAKKVFNWVAFAESSFFPLPPDLLMLPMLLANRMLAWTLAFQGTIMSVLGGAVGYAIGYFLYNSLGEWIITTYGMEQAFQQFQQGFDKWGFWIIALKGVTPIPYKIVTISSGLAGFNFWIFMGASIICRGGRFYMLAAFMYSLVFSPYLNRHCGRILNLKIYLKSPTSF